MISEHSSICGSLNQYFALTLQDISIFVSQVMFRKKERVLSELVYSFSSQSSGRPYSRTNFKKSDGGPLVENNSCVVLCDCKVVFASEMERFTHVKHDCVEPYLPLLYFKHYFNASELSQKGSIDTHVTNEHQAKTPRDFFLHATNNSDILVKDYTQSQIQHDHHENHIYEAFYQSGFKEAAVLVNDRYDAKDKDVCISLAYIKEGQEPKILKQFSKNVSICYVYYEAAKQIFNQSYAEGKLMGLSSYGKNNGQTYISWDDKLKTIVTDENHGKEAILSFLKKCKTNKYDVMSARDLAFTIQKNFEDVMVEIVKYFKQLLEDEEIHTDNLCMSGGGILNCPTNSKIISLGLFKHYFASPHTSDACAESIGRVFRNMQIQGKQLKSQRLETSYLGVVYPRNELIYKHKKIEKPNECLSNALKNGEVIAWYQGAAEYGPRALGHRSFLANPATQDMLNALNIIKGREAWRPLAPVVPEELFQRIFEVDNTDMCEFMLRTLKIKERWRSRLKAVCHIDGTTRPQLLKRKVNPRLYDLIMSFFEKTHIPCLVNTSLNINGFPIVETPRDFCHLIEEISLMKNIPKTRYVFVDSEETFDVILD